MYIKQQEKLKPLLNCKQLLYFIVRRYDGPVPLDPIELQNQGWWIYRSVLTMESI